jgi:hypothetical protein
MPQLVTIVWRILLKREIYKFVPRHLSFDKYRAVGIVASVRAERNGIRIFAVAKDFALRQIVQISSVSY